MKAKNQLAVAPLAKGNQFLATFKDCFLTISDKFVEHFLTISDHFLNMGWDISKHLDF